MDYFSGWCKSKKRLDGITAVVTGCNTGIGKETVKDLYSRGARVIMACRSVQKANEAKNDIESTVTSTGSLQVELLDLCSLKSVRQFSDKLISSEPHINILVNNAGVMMCPEGKTEDGLETHIGSNHFAHALLTFLLLPKLKESGPSRIVFVSSMVHKWNPINLDDLNFEKTPYNANKAYCSSKCANILFAKALAAKLKEHNITNVTTYSLHPGVIRTGIGRHFSQTLIGGASWFWKNILGWFLKSPKCGAQTTIYCAIDDACAEQSGLYYQDCKVANASRQCQNIDVAKKLWDKTVEALNFTEEKIFSN